MEKKKKMSKKVKIILIISVLFVALISGIGAYFLTEANRAPAEIEDGEAKFKTYLKEAPNDGSLPTDHDPLDVIAYVLWKVENTEEFKVVTTGSADASITTQLISNERIVKNKEAMVSTISSGMVSLAKQKFYSNNKVLLRDYAKLDGINATWKTDVPECISYKEMISRYGWLPFQANGYIICEETYLNKENIKIEVLEDGLYKIAFDLNPEADYAPFWYRREILTNSGSTIIPEFLSIHAEFTFDKDYRIVYQDFKEAYKVKAMGVEAETKTDVRDAFTYDNVEFNQEYLDYFRSYKDPTPKEFTGEEMEIKMDVATMIISSLQNGSDDVPFDVVIDVNGNKLNGNVALNISDLNNVKVLANIAGIEVEFIDNTLYLALGELKLKGTILDITTLIPSSGSIGMSALDLNQILSDLNNATVTTNDNNKNIIAKLNLLGIELNLEFDITEADGDYVLNNGKAKVTIEGNDITVNLSKGNKTFDKKDYSSYSEIKNAKFIVDTIIAILNNKKLGLDGNVSYKDLSVTLSGDLSFDNGLKANCNLELNYKDISINANIKYINDTLYFNYGNIYLSIDNETLSKYVSSFVSGDSISIDNIVDKLFKADLSKLISEFKLDENHLNISLELNELIDKIDTIKLEFIKDESFNVNVLYQDLKASIKLRDYNEIENPTSDYLKVSDISYIIDNVFAIIDSKKLKAELTLNYEGNVIGAIAYLDFEKDIKLKVSANIAGINMDLYYFKEDNKIYIDYNDFNAYISLDKFVKDDNIDVNTVLSIVSKLELDKVINYLKYSNDITSIGLDLSELNLDTKGLINLDDIINIDIKKKDNGLNIRIEDIYNLNINLLSRFNGDISIDKNNYYSLDSYIDTIIDFINSDKYRFDISGEYKEAKITASGILDRTNLSLKLDVNVKYNEESLDLSIAYVDNNIYLDLYDTHVKLPLDEIKKYIDINKDDLSIKDIINKVLSIDLGKILSELMISDNGINLGLDLSSLNIDTKGIIDLSNKINATIKNIDGGLNVNIDLFNLDIMAVVTTDEIVFNDNDYYDLSSFVGDIDTLIKLVNKESFRLEINAKANIKNFVDLLSKDIKIAGYVDFIYDEGYSINANLNVKYDNIGFDINLIYSNDYIYVSMLGLDIKLKVSELPDLIEEIMTKLELDNNSSIDTSSLISKAFGVIKTIKIGDDIKLDLSSLFDKLSIITIKILNGDKYNVNVNMSFMDIDIYVKSIDKYQLDYKDSYIESDEILKIVDMANKVLDIAKNKSFNINLDLSVFDTDVKHLDISGNLKFKIYDNGKFDFEASVTIVQYEKDNTKYHYLDLILVSKEYFATVNGLDPYENNTYSDMVYITYGTIPNSNSKIKIYLPLNNLFDIVSTLGNVLDVDLSFLDKYLESFDDFNFNNIDTNQIKNLLSDSTREKNITLNNLINYINVDSDELSIGLDISNILPQEDGNIVDLVLDLNEHDNVMAKLSLMNLYTTYNSYADNTMINVNNITLVSDDVNISAPNTSGYYNVKDLNKLVKGLIVTTSFKNFEISGSAKMAIGSLDLITLPFDIKVTVDEDGKPTIYAHLDLDSTLAAIAFDSVETNIYYKDEYVYIYRKDRKKLTNLFSNPVSQVKIKANTFLDDIVYYLLEYGMGATSIVMNSVNSTDSNKNHVIDAGKVLTNYSVSGNEYTLGLSLNELTGNSSLGNLALTLGLTDFITDSETGETAKALTTIKNLSVDLLGFINIKIDSMKLANIVDGKENTVSMNELDSYISGYSYDVDTFIYKGKKDGSVSHKITFIPGFGYSETVIEGVSGTNITYPTYDIVSYNNVSYKFIGWYKDKELTEEFTDTKILNDNIDVYAKYEKI